jgi:endonuclease/exonuclease/phosphatase (EEP) superfamily protein YafD
MTTAGADRSAPVSVLIGLTGGFGLLLIGATLGALVGSWWWPLDLLSSFHPQYAVLLTLVGLFHLLVRSRATAVWLLAVACINAAIVAPSLVGWGPDHDAPGPYLSVMSFNVGVSNPMRREVARYVDEERPDLLFVLESSFEWEDTLGRWGPPMAVIAIVPRGRVSGITVLADTSIQARSVPVAFADPGEAVAVEVTLGSERIVVLGIHPPSPTGGDRAAHRDRILSDAGDWIAAMDVPVLVVGDFNATPWSHAFATLQFRGRLIDTSDGAGLQPSWPSGWGPVMIPIDNALHTAGLVTVARSTGPPLGSAHLPLLVTVAGSG